MRQLSLFSGIGGGDLAAKWAGIETVAMCEREPFPRKVLQKNFPGIPIYDDVHTLNRKVLERDGIIGSGRAIDALSAGYPCQPESNAGKRRGKEDDRWLWPQVRRILDETRPSWFIGENVFGHVSMGLDTVLTELESDDYAVEPIIIPACAVGAPHRRDRVIVLGYTTSQGLSIGGQSNINSAHEEAREGLVKQPERSGQNVADAESDVKRRLSIREEAQIAGFKCSSENVANTTSGRFPETWKLRCEQSEKRIASGCETHSKPERSAQSRLGGVLDGISDWMDRHQWPAGYGAEQYDWEPPRVATGVKDRTGRLKGLGNAINPYQLYPFYAAIKAIHDNLKT